MNTLYYGDNLKILRDYIKDESVDLVYLDPPFNSNRNYNVLFRNESGSDSESQCLTPFAYSNPYYGHLFGTHAADKTSSDPAKAMAMSAGTFGALVSYGRSMGCKCNANITPDVAVATATFANLPGAYFPSLYTIDDITTHGSYLANKVKTLGVPYR